jgi:hypothetical protein
MHRLVRDDSQNVPHTARRSASLRDVDTRIHVSRCESELFVHVVPTSKLPHLMVGRGSVVVVAVAVMEAAIVTAVGAVDCVGEAEGLAVGWAVGIIVGAADVAVVVGVVVTVVVSVDVLVAEVVGVLVSVVVDVVVAVGSDVGDNDGARVGAAVGLPVGHA